MNASLFLDDRKYLVPKRAFLSVLILIAGCGLAICQFSVNEIR
jgi:hypothetical protein